MSIRPSETMNSINYRYDVYISACTDDEDCRLIVGVMFRLFVEALKD
jgi:hypothetical protein